MTDPVQTAVYALGVDPSEWNSGMDSAAQSSTNFINSAEKITVQTENVDKATRSTTDSISKLEARVDSSVASEQRRQSALQQVQRALEEGTISQTRALAVSDKVNSFYGQTLPGTFGQFASTATSAFGKVESVIGLLGPLLGITVGAGILQFTRTTIDNVAALQEQANQIGINVEKYQQLQFAAHQSGLNNDDLNAGLNHLSKTLGEAEAGVQKSQDVFAKWGIAIKDSHGNALDLETVLGEVADRFTSITNPALKTAAAVDLTSRSGLTLINFLSQGSVAMADMEKKAVSLGAVIGTDTVEKAKAAKDELALLSDVVSAKLSIAFVSVLPSAKSLADLLDRMSNTSGPLMMRLGQIIGATALDSYKPGLGKAWLQSMNSPSSSNDNSSGDLSIAIHKPSAQEVRAGQLSRAKDLGDLPGTGSTGSGGFTPFDPAAARGLDDYLKKLQELHDLTSLSARDQAVQKAVNDIPFKDAAAALPGYIQKVKDAAAANYDLEHAVAGQAALDTYLKKLQDLHDLGSLSARDQAVQKSVDEAEAIARQHDTKATDDYIAKVKQASGANYDHAQAVAAVSAASKEMATDFTNGLDAILTGTKSVTDALGQLAQQLEQIILKAAIENPLQNYATNLISGSAGSGGFLGDIFSGIFGGGRATGGPVSAGMLYNVNENGPELFAPNVDGRVIPLGGSMPQATSSSSSSSVSINVVVPDKVASNPAAARASSTMIAQMARAAVRDEIMNQQRQGGLLTGTR